MPKKECLFLSALFSAYFLIFAASPIAGTTEFARAYGQSCDPFDVKLLIADLLPGIDKRAGNHIHPAKVLFKKKRAVLSAGSKAASNPGEFLRSAGHPSVPDRAIENAAGEDGAGKYIINARRCCSGLSPPPA